MARGNGRYSFLLVFLLGTLIQAEAAGTETQDIFERHKNGIVLIRVLNISSDAKVSVGSGFVASPAGLIVTNYHVISDLVHKPDQYRAEVVRQDGTSGPLVLLNFDAIHDLAIIKTDSASSHYFELRPEPLRKGSRVFSIGTPLDLGFTIVEGTYSGLLEESLYEKVHFTGSINPGMSGGPAIIADGPVVGVNVATAGNQVSFLVPVKFVKKLLDETSVNSRLDGKTALQQLRTQLLEHQDSYMTKLMALPLPTTALNQYRLPWKIAPFLKCWGDTDRRTENLFVSTTQECFSEDHLYVSRSQASGIFSFKHDLLTTDKLNSLRFFRLYQNYFKSHQTAIRADKEDVTRFRCNSDFVMQNAMTLKAVMCLRAYKKLPGLYDAVLRAATLDKNDTGVQTTLVLAGVSYENATRFGRKYLESISWTK